VAEFAALPPRSVCDMVVYLCLHGAPAALAKVGAESLRYYTEHLLHDPCRVSITRCRGWSTTRVGRSEGLTPSLG
jgi:hypothetical protein